MNIDELNRCSSELRTKIGKAFLCERAVLRGKDIHHEMGSWTWFKTFLFAITGRELQENQLRMLNYFWVATSYPDPSIWPNHVAALGGSARTTSSLAQIAGMAISEASIYGRKPERKALDFFYRAEKKSKSGVSLESIVEDELETNRIIYGYGRPLARLDERVPHTLKKIEELGLEQGEHFQRALSIYRYLKETRGLSMNIAAVNTALVADMKLTPEEYQLFLTPCFITGMVPCYIDARDNPEGSFFPVRCENLSYTGVSERKWEA
jgi:hypothetical protein